MWLAAANSSQAIIAYDADVTPAVIFGSGNGNGFWTVDLENNVEVGLRAKLRGQGVYNSEGDGTYIFDPGVSSGTAALWNYEFSVNVDQDGTSGADIANYQILLSIDVDPTAGQSWITFSPFDAWTDNSFGNNSTLQSGGIEGVSAAAQVLLMSNYNVAQNSQNLGWAPIVFDPYLDATYDFALEVHSRQGLVAATGMTVIVGEGGAAVPEAGMTMTLLGMSCVFIAGLRRRMAS
jgi:hypothetical protein